MQRIILTVILFASPLFASPLYAQMNAGTLAEHCRTAVAWVGGADARATFEIRSCYSYVVGIADAHKYLVAAGKMASPGFCVITEITDKQLANVFLSYYNRDRTKLEFVPAAEVVLKAMFDKFPCKS